MASPASGCLTTTPHPAGDAKRPLPTSTLPPPLQTSQNLPKKPYLCKDREGRPGSGQICNFSANDTSNIKAYNRLTTFIAEDKLAKINGYIY